MHWACAFGKPNIVKLLLEKDLKKDFLGDLEPGTLASKRIKGGSNALSLAIGNRNRECVEAIVNSEQCKAAMKIGEMRKTDPDDENSPELLATPLRDLIREWPDLVNRALNEFIGDNLKTASKENKSWQKWLEVTADSANFEISLDYTILDDTFDNEIAKAEDENDTNGVLTAQDSNANDARIEIDDTSPIVSKEDPDKAEKKVATRSMLKKNHPLMIMVNENKKVVKNI